MASEIRVTNIKANDGTASLTVADSTGNVSVGGAITASGGIANAGTISAGVIGSSVTGTLGSGIVFPDGMITNTTIKQYKFDTNTSYANQSADERIFSRESDTSTTVSSFTAKQGYTYIINMIYYAYIARESGTNSGRSATIKMYYGTTSRSQGGTTFDTKLHSANWGRAMVSATTSASASFSGAYNMVGSFYQSGADQTIYYYGTSYQGSTDKNVTTYMSADHPAYDVIYEIRGNKLTTET